MTKPTLAIVVALATTAFAAEPPRVVTLEDALAVARARQPQVRQAQASTEAALARTDESLAPLLPQIAGNAGYSRSTANYTSRPGSLPSQISSGSGSESWTTYSYFNLGLSANQLLWDFGQTRSRWRAARASARSQQSTEKATLLQVLSDVRTAYFQARAAKALVAVAKETLENQQKHLQQTEGFVEVGTKPEIDLALAKTNVANARVALITAENNYAVAKAQLTQAMGAPISSDFDVSDESFPAVVGEDGPAATLAQEAIDDRPELASFADAIRAGELTVQAVRGAYGPSLGASTGFTDAGEQANNLTWNWSAALSLSVPLFQGGATRAQVREARANLAAVQAQADNERQQVLLEVEQARLSVRAAKAALTASDDALTNAKEQLRLAEGRYETGVGNIIELSDAQLALTTASQQRVDADYTLAQARVGLLRALGRE
jgi:outer membrane protein